MILKMVENSGDVETQRQALLTLTNLCANDINHSTMMQKQIMRVLNNAYASADADCREYAAFCIANIAANPDYVAMVGNNGGIPPLIMLTRSQSVNTACLGVSALRRLANNEDNWPKLIEGGILDSLSTMGFSLELEIAREVAASLCSLSLSEPHRVEIAYKCILALVHLASSGDMDVARQVRPFAEHYFHVPLMATGLLATVAPTSPHRISLFPHDTTLLSSFVARPRAGWPTSRKRWTRTSTSPAPAAAAP